MNNPTLEWFVPGVCIQTRVDELHERAQKEHKNWLAHPQDMGAKRKFAFALLDLAREIKNKTYENHALRLIGETD